MKRRSLLILILLLALALTGISFYGGPVTYVFFWLVVLTPVSSLLYIAFVLFFLKIYQRSEGRAMVASTPSDFYITLNNETFLSFSSVRIVFYSSFSTVSGLDDRKVYELPPHSSLTQRTRLVCRYRGEYLVGIKEISVTDHLGLFTITRRIKEPLSVIVSPAIVKLDGLRAGDDIPDPDRESLTMRTEKSIPVREYVPGDDTRLIHQKASAIMQKPMVRELTGIEGDGIAVIMEKKRRASTPEEYLPTENRIIESTIALALYYLERNIPVDVIYRSDRAVCEPVRDNAGFERLYASLRGYVFSDEDGTVRLLDELCSTHTANRYRMLIFILTDIGKDEEELIAKMNAASVPVRIYIAGSEPGEEDHLPLQSSGEIICIGSSDPTEDVL